MARGFYALLFVTPFDTDTLWVDRATGGYGYGHVALWNGTFSGDTPIVLDSSMTQNGVFLRPLLDMTRGVPYQTLRLDDRLGEWVYSRAMRCLGAKYDFAGLMRRRAKADAYTCSGLVCSALPRQLADRCRHRWRPISPNDIARGLNVPPWRS